MEHEHTYEELHKKTLAQLREFAAELNHPEVQGYTQLHKAELLPKLCAALGIPTQVHHEVVGINKTKVKGQIRELKGQRDQALVDKDSEKLQSLRREIHKLKRKLRRAAV